MYENKFKSSLLLTVLIMLQNSDAQIYVQKLEGDMLLINLTVKNATISEYFRRFNEGYVSQWVKRNSFNIIDVPVNLEKNVLNLMKGLKVSDNHTTKVSANMGFAAQESTNTQTIGQWLLSYSCAMALVTPFTLVAIFLYPCRRNSHFVQKKHLLAGVFLLFNFTMVSGQMWNQIKAPSFYHNSKNSPVYIKDGSHGQFILENYIVASSTISFFLYWICCLWNILAIFNVFLVHYSQ